jgi:exonuclease VII small subunit
LDHSDLEKALAGWEKLAETKVPAAEQPDKDTSVSGFDDAIKNAEGIVKYLKECDGQLDKVASAAKKAEAELKKLGDKLKDAEKRKYQDAASAASLINANAGVLKKKIA